MNSSQFTQKPVAPFQSPIQPVAKPISPPPVLPSKSDMPPAQPMTGGKKARRVTKKPCKKGGALLDDVKNLAVPFAILLAKQGLTQMFEKNRKKAAATPAVRRPAVELKASVPSRRRTVAGGSCGSQCARAVQNAQRGGQQERQQQQRGGQQERQEQERQQQQREEQQCEQQRQQEQEKEQQGGKKKGAKKAPKKVLQQKAGQQEQQQQQQSKLRQKCQNKQEQIKSRFEMLSKEIDQFLQKY